MEKLSFKIDEILFEIPTEITIDGNTIHYFSDDTFDYLEMYCLFAPVYYLRKFREKESLYSMLGFFTYLCFFTSSFNKDIYNLARTKLYFDSIDTNGIEKKIITFINLVLDRLQNKISQLDFIEKFLALNIHDEPEFTPKTNSQLWEIIGLCSLLEKTDINIICIKIVRLIKRVFSNINHQLEQNINNIATILGINLIDIISFLFLKNSPVLVIQKCFNLLQNTIRLLSQTPNESEDYSKKMKQMCEQVLDSRYELPKKRFSGKCLSIIDDDKNVYFSISGTEDYYKSQYYNKVKNWADDIKKIFNKNAIWCELSENTRNYIDKKSIDKTNYKYINNNNGYELLKDEIDKEKYLEYYKCCERKILGSNTNINRYDLFILLEPCFRCTKAVMEKYDRIYAYFDKISEWKISVKNNEPFIPKEYIITRKGDKYISVSKRE